LFLIVFAIARVIRTGFCCSSEWFGPEKTAFCSEAPDEDALIRIVVDVAFQKNKKKEEK